MIDILRQIAVVLGSLAFLAVCWWAFSPKRKQRFEEDAKLPFADEEPSSDETGENKKTSGDNSGADQKQGQDK